MVKEKCPLCRGWGKVFVFDKHGNHVYLDGKRMREICPKCWGSRFFKPKVEKTMKMQKGRRRY